MKLIRKTIQWCSGLYRSYTTQGGFHDEENQLKKKYYPASAPRKNIQQQHVIAMVDGRVTHGGLSDRIRGIVSIYAYCKENHIPFSLHYVYPFQLEDYLQPASVDWRIKPEDISYHPEEAIPVLLTCDRLPNKHHRRYLRQVLKKHPNKQIHVYTNTQFLDKQFHICFNELFRPVDVLQKAVDKYVEQGGKKFIGMTFRFIQLLGDFKEDGYKTLSPQEQEILIQKCIRMADKLHAEKHPNMPVLITSDSITFLQRIQKELSYAFTIEGEIVHIDYTPNASFNIYLKTWLDILTLSKAQKIYTLCTGDMYKSGFGKRAARISGIDFETICF